MEHEMTAGAGPLGSGEDAMRDGGRSPRTGEQLGSEHQPASTARHLLADWKAKTDAATQGPWEARTSEATMNDRSEWRIGRPDMPQVARSVMQAADAAFIAVSRTAVPRLLAAVESVLALHTPATRYTAAGWEEVSFESRAEAAEYGDTEDVKEFTVCHECGLIETHDGGEERCYEYSLWPCPTVRAINEALEGDTDAE